MDIIAGRRDRWIFHDATALVLHQMRNDEKSLTIYRQMADWQPTAAPGKPLITNGTTLARFLLYIFVQVPT